MLREVELSSREEKIIKEIDFNINGLVLAGGFPAAILYFKNQNIDYLYVDSVLRKFSDYDFWVLKNSEAFMRFEFFISNIIFDLNKSKSYSFLNSAGLMFGKEFDNYNISNSTKYAFTLTKKYTPGSFFDVFKKQESKFKEQPVQIIKNSYNNIEELLSSYDLSICQAAYADKKLYFTDEFQKTIDTKYLSFKDIKTVVGLQRIFKYLDRYDLKLDNVAQDKLKKFFFKCDGYLTDLRALDVENINRLIKFLENYSDILEIKVDERLYKKIIESKNKVDFNIIKNYISVVINGYQTAITDENIKNMTYEILLKYLGAKYNNISSLLSARLPFCFQNGYLDNKDLLYFSNDDPKIRYAIDSILRKIK